MKKFLFILMIMLAVTLTLTNANASVANKITVKVNGEIINFDVDPYIDNGRTMVPIRFISEALGAKVDWNGTYRLVTITLNDMKIEQKIDKTVAIVNGQEVSFDMPAVIKNDRTMVPVRFVSEALGANVVWEELTRTVVITTKKAEPTPTPTPVPEQTAVTAKPTPYDPAKWVRVSENGEDAELAINIEWNDHDKFMSNCNYAESIIAKKYNTEIAKKVVDIARKKTDRSTQFSEQLNFNGKKIDIYVWGSSIGIYFWKAGVV